MWEVEDILAEVCQRRGQGTKWWYEVKWKGYHLPTMEPVENLQHTEARRQWEQFTEPCQDPDTQLLPAGFQCESNQTHPDVPSKRQTCQQTSQASHGLRLDLRLDSRSLRLA
jgi:hypothetical protein